MTPIKKLLQGADSNSQKNLAETFKSDLYKNKEDERDFENSPYKKRENRTTLPGLNKINNAQLSSRGEAIKRNKSNFNKAADQASSEVSSISQQINENISSHHPNYIRGKQSALKTAKIGMSPILLRDEVSPLVLSKVTGDSITPLALDDHKIKFIVKSAYKSKAGNNGGVQKTNQDSTLCKLSGLKKEGFNLYGVMDGHGSHGHFISSSVKAFFSEFIFKASHYEDNATLDSIHNKLVDKDYSIIKHCFQNCESSLARSKYEVNFSGTTAVMVIQIDDIVICANTGDSRAILFGSDGITELSKDHKPDNENELQRILSSGGRVEKYKDNGNPVGPFRVWLKYDDYPGLAMSRSMGDFVAKSVGCSCIPEIIQFNLTEKSYFMIIASDGVWEFLNNSTVVKIVEPFYKKKDPEGASAKLVEESANAWKKVSQLIFNCYRRTMDRTIYHV